MTGGGPFHFVPFIRITHFHIRAEDDVYTSGPREFWPRYTAIHQYGWTLGTHHEEGLLPLACYEHSKDGWLSIPSTRGLQATEIGGGQRRNTLTNFLEVIPRGPPEGRTEERDGDGNRAAWDRGMDGHGTEGGPFGRTGCQRRLCPHLVLLLFSSRTLARYRP